jgi:hypothetical protein
MNEVREMTECLPDRVGLALYDQTSTMTAQDIDLERTSADEIHYGV